MDADRVGPEDVAALKEALATAQVKTLAVTAELAVARAKEAEDMALIAHQKLRIAQLTRQLYGQKSERSARLAQLALMFEEAETAASEDELAAEKAVANAVNVLGFKRKRPEHRQTFPEHLPRERVVVDPPGACQCCGGTDLRKLGETVSRTLESVPRQWKVVETVREKFSCRDCEKISQAPAPFHAVPRGWAGPSLLAMFMFEKFGQHRVSRTHQQRWRKVWNCVGDEGRPLGVGDQESGAKPPRAAVVKSDGGERRGKGRTGSCQVRTRETSESKPPMRGRNRIDDVRTGGGVDPEISLGGVLKPGPGGIRLIGGVNLGQAVTRNGRTCRPDAKGVGQAGQPHEAMSTDAGHRDRTVRSRGEGAVMVLDRRGCGVQPWHLANR